MVVVVVVVVVVVKIEGTDDDVEDLMDVTGLETKDGTSTDCGGEISDTDFGLAESSAEANNEAFVLSKETEGLELADEEEARNG